MAGGGGGQAGGRARAGGRASGAGGVGPGLTIRSSLPAAPAAADPLPEQTAGTDRNTSLRSPTSASSSSSSAAAAGAAASLLPAPPRHCAGAAAGTASAQPQPGPAAPSPRTRSAPHSPAEVRTRERASAVAAYPRENRVVSQGLTEERRQPAAGMGPGGQRWEGSRPPSTTIPDARPPGGTGSGSGLGSVGRKHPARRRVCFFCLSFPGSSFRRTHRGASLRFFFSSWSGSPPAGPRALSLPSPSSLHVCRDCPIPVVFLTFSDKFSSSPGWLPDSPE